ncbi:AAA family ATPase [Zavarzinella formosa]|uniref:AAA family ATPase n=1 Tax=Zavarzinella formosa TaxID=360055 RepID=UPI0002FF51AC|nr:AAA family ATPase [Zavarzinella formosa]
MLIPDPSLVVLIGPSGSGKSTFARKHFKPTEILSSDAFRAMISDDESDQHATPGAFELLHLTAAKRLQYSRLTVIDATNVKTEARRQCLDVARKYHLPAIAIVFQLDEATCVAQNQQRPDRQVPDQAIKRHIATLDQMVRQIQHEGFREIRVFRTAAEAETITIKRQRHDSWKRHLNGPFDLIGDVHGCLPELLELLTKLGYGLEQIPEADGGKVWEITPPDQRQLLFVGDLVDRGPDTPGVLRLVRHAIRQGKALSVRGNHDDKLQRKLSGRDVNISSGLADSLEQISREPIGFAEEMRGFLDSLPLHLVFDGGRLVVSHAGLKSELHGRDSDRVRAFCLFGDTTGEYDQYGLPIRLNWAADYHGSATVVYGHVPTYQPQWVNKTLCIDTGCVFGGWLTAVRYPEMEMVSVRSHGKFADPKKPFMPTEESLPPT